MGRRKMTEDDYIDDVYDEPDYRRLEDIDPNELRNALNLLQLLGDDPLLRMQSFNLSIVDPFLTGLEYEVRDKLHEEESTPVPEAAFLSAQSQMWIFAAYELLRTWRQRSKDIIKWFENGGLEAKREAFEKDSGYRHFGRQFRAKQVKQVIEDPTIIDKIRIDLRLTHMMFARLEALRVSIAKHEVRGRKNSVALMPGHGRINRWCGSIDFELVFRPKRMIPIRRI